MMATGQTESPAPVRVAVDATQRSPLRRIWRYVGYDELNNTYTPRGRELLLKLARLPDGPYFVRAHYLLCSGDGTGRPKWGSSNVYAEDASGSPIYSWEIIDRVLDTYVGAGLVPFVELGFCPEALTTAPKGTPYEELYNGGYSYPPRDYERWQGLIQALASHCLARYGLREVRRWYWELWNEPDIFYWSGTAEEYCRLYDHTVAGLLSALPQARVGGPGTTNPDNARAGAFLRTFLEHCLLGRNAATGEIGARLDFVSFHTKGGGYRVDSTATKQPPTIYALVHNVVTGLNIIDGFPELSGHEVVLTECDPDGRAAFGRHDNANLEFRNTNYYASYVATAACKLLDLAVEGRLRVDGMLTWAFEFENRDYFEGLRTLSSNGIDKSVLNTFRLLSLLGAMRLPLESEACRAAADLVGPDTPAMPPDLSGIAAIDASDDVQVLLVNHHDDWDVDTPIDVDLHISGLEIRGDYRVERMTIDENAGNAYTAWVQMGEPQPPSEAQLTALRRAARLQTDELCVVPAHEGRVSQSVTLPDHSVTLLRFVRL